MNFTSISLSYAFLIIGIGAILFFLYFKVLVVKTGKNKASRDEIVGKMKDPDDWRNRNNRMAYVSLFWALVSLGIFVYLKFFYTVGLVSFIYPLILLIAIVISVPLLGIRKKTAK